MNKMCTVCGYTTTEEYRSVCPECPGWTWLVDADLPRPVLKLNFDKYFKEQDDANKESKESNRFNPKYFCESFMKAYKEEKDK